MPTYTVATMRHLDQVTRTAIAEAIAVAHTRVTGAARIFAQIVFQERSQELVTVGGEPADQDHIFVDATIRAGRPNQLVDDLVVEIVRAVSAAAAVDPASVWLYVRELDPERMVEYGSVLPQPGAEDAWLATTFGSDPAHATEPAIDARSDHR